MTSLADITDVEAVSKAVPTDDRPRVLRLIEMVSARAVTYTGQIFEYVEDDEITLVPHDGVLRLPQRPVLATSIVINGSTIDPSVYTVDASTGIVRRLSPTLAGPDSTFACLTGSWPIDGEWPWPPNTTYVTYSHGYPDGVWPADVSMVVAEKVAAKWLSGQRMAEGLGSESIDGYAATYPALAHVTAGNAWDPEHAEILDHYRRAKFTSVRLG